MPRVKQLDAGVGADITGAASNKNHGHGGCAAKVAKFSLPSIGQAQQGVRACLLRQITPLMGAPLLTEYEAVLGRDDLFLKSRLEAHERDALLDVLVALCEWTRVYYLWRPNLPDESDNHLIELAVAGGAEFIVTRNLRDLQAGQLQWPNLRMISPENFLKEI